MTIFGQYHGYTFFEFVPRNATYSRRYDPLYCAEPEECGYDQQRKLELKEKNQRSAVQSKRHKARRIHQAPDKEVPSILKNFVKRAAGYVEEGHYARIGGF